MSLGTATLGTGVLGTSADKIVIEVIVKTELMPRDARDAIIDYIQDSFNENLWRTIDELTNLLSNLPA